MAKVLKAGKTFIDKTGTPHSNPYLVIDYCPGSKRPNRQYQNFIVEIYRDQEARNAGSFQPVSFTPYTVEGEDWKTFFSPVAITADNDQYARAYAYISQLREKITQPDGSIIDGELIYKDWEDLP